MLLREVSNKDSNVDSGHWEIVVRGYDKLFSGTRIRSLKIHSLLIRCVKDLFLSQKGRQLLDRHLYSAGQTIETFTKVLADNNVTAVFEFADDEFEEHI